MIVVDASTVVAALVESGRRGDESRNALASGGRLHAPQHLPLEVVHTLRGMALGKKLTAEAAEAALGSFAGLTVKLVPTVGAVLERVWGLRHNITAYDAAYVAVAERLEVPLVTGDVRLAAADGPTCEMRVLR